MFHLIENAVARFVRQIVLKVSQVSTGQAISSFCIFERCCDETVQGVWGGTAHSSDSSKTRQGIK